MARSKLAATQRFTPGIPASPPRGAEGDRAVYYVIETEDLRPETLRSGTQAHHTCEICTYPPQTNLSHEERVDGYLGTTNDWAQYAHGAYSRLRDARRCCHRQGYTDPRNALDEGVVECWGVPGEEWAVQDWLQNYSPETDRLSIRSTDRRYDQVARRICREAGREGVRLLGDVHEWLRETVRESAA